MNVDKQGINIPQTSWPSTNITSSDKLILSALTSSISLITIASGHGEAENQQQGQSTQSLRGTQDAIDWIKNVEMLSKISQRWQCATLWNYALLEGWTRKCKQGKMIGRLASAHIKSWPMLLWNMTRKESVRSCKIFIDICEWSQYWPHVMPLPNQVKV